MQKIILFLFFFFLLITSCNQTKKEGIIAEEINPMDTVAYQNKTYYKFTTAELDTTSISINTLTINEKSILADSVNRAILESFSSAERPIQNLTTYMDTFIKNYQDYVKENPTDPHMAWYEENDIQVISNTAHFFSIQISNSNFSGGAHPNSYVSNLNFDRKTGKRIRLNDIFQAGFESKLNELAEPLFRDQQSIPDSISLEDAGYFVWEDSTKGQFRFNDNFSLEKKGIEFYFNSYEIACYAVGPSEVLIPYTALKGILRKEFESKIQK